MENPGGRVKVVRMPIFQGKTWISGVLIKSTGNPWGSIYILNMRGYNLFLEKPIIIGRIYV